MALNPAAAARHAARHIVRSASGREAWRPSSCQRIAVIPEAKRNAVALHRVTPEIRCHGGAEYRSPSRALARPINCAPPMHRRIEALVVPVAPSAPPSARTQLYTVRQGRDAGDHLDRFGVSLSQLRRWNKITGHQSAAGQRLHVADPASAPHMASASIAPEALNQPRMSATPRRQRAQPQSLPAHAPRKRSADLQRNMAPAKHSGTVSGAKKSEQQAPESLP